jgi:hypothetical protein
MSPSAISDFGGTVARMVTVKGSMSTERHSKFLSYLTGARYFLSAVSVLVVAQPSSDVLEGLMNYPVLLTFRTRKLALTHPLPNTAHDIFTKSFYSAKYNTKYRSITE